MGRALSPEAKTQSRLSSMKQNWSQNPSASDPELLKPLAQKREGARGPRRERVEGRILDGLSMDEFSSPALPSKASTNYGCNNPSPPQVMSSQS